jgi:Type IV secretion system pilin
MQTKSYQLRLSDKSKKNNYFMKQIFLLLALSLTFLTIAVSAQSAITLNDFNPLKGGGITCLYSTININAPTAAGVNCKPENGLLNRIETLLYILAPAFAVIGVMVGGYRIMQDGYEAKGEGMKTIKGSILGFIIVLSAFFIRDLVFKVVNGVLVTPSTDYTNAGVKAIIDILNTIAYQILVPIGSPIAVGYIIWGGYKLITAGGDPKQVSSAFATIKNAIIGFLVIIFAVVLVSVSQRLAGAFLRQI